jgi:catalase
LALGAASALLEAAGVFPTLPDGNPDPGVLCIEPEALGDGLEAFTAALVRHRHWSRETDPPTV